MSQIVHITFEKLTGLKGDIEGEFILTSGTPDKRLPLVLDCWIIPKNTFVFKQGENRLYMKPVNWRDSLNYAEHFFYGTNFLIKSWSYGGGVTINSQPPN